jgi:hypothetical protein
LVHVLDAVVVTQVRDAFVTPTSICAPVILVVVLDALYDG